MANLKRNYILAIYDSDEDDISFEKLYCTKEEARIYMAHKMYEYIESEYSNTGDNDCVESAAIGRPMIKSAVELNGFIQFYDWHVTLELYRTKKMQKTEIEFRHPRNDIEKALVEDGDIFMDYNEEYDYETGTRI